MRWNTVKCLTGFWVLFSTQCSHWIGWISWQVEQFFMCSFVWIYVQTFDCYSKHNQLLDEQEQTRKIQSSFQMVFQPNHFDTLPVKRVHELNSSKWRAEIIQYLCIQLMVLFWKKMNKNALQFDENMVFFWFNCHFRTV